MLDVVDLTPKIGSEVKIDKATLLAGTHGREIRELLTRRGVVVVRDIPVSDDEQRAIAESLGELRSDSVRKEVMTKVEHFPGPFFWHMDGTYEEFPPLATMLSPRVLSKQGGQTEFANTYAAFEDLPEDKCERLIPLRVLHTMQASLFHAYPEATLSDIEHWLTFPNRTHPLVWQHTSGRRSLVLSSSAAHVIGMDVARSRELIDELLAHVTSQSYVYRHEWRMGDIVMWDNTGTMHRVRPYPADCGRELHRFTLVGQEPIAAVA